MFYNSDIIVILVAPKSKYQRKPVYTNVGCITDKYLVNENRNLVIYAANLCARAVVMVSAAGKLRFKNKPCVIRFLRFIFR